ncbi:MAG: DUF1385 domain-containing protein [Clostridia bacterium]|nr:DUF1385 domain-containing protein [Clostridia bacterium]
MMRGPDRMAYVIRKPDNTFAQKVESLAGGLKERMPVFKLPLIRGVYAFIDSIVNGISAINYSASFFEELDDPDYKPSKFETFLEEKVGDKLGGVIMAVSMILGVAIALGLFVVLPTFLVGTVGANLPFMGKNLLEGLVRLVLFILYIWAVSKTPDIKRVFMYHGAEHKTIFCYEHKEKPTVENVKKYRRFHPRCGTSFLLIVMIISIIVFSFLKWDNLLQRSACRILLMPVVMALSYEVIRLAGKYDNLATRIISAPGLWLQRLTTSEPDPDMIEVAIRALNLVRDDLTDEEKEELTIMPEPKPKEGKDKPPEGDAALEAAPDGEIEGEAADAAPAADEAETAAGEAAEAAPESETDASAPEGDAR